MMIVESPRIGFITPRSTVPTSASSIPPGSEVSGFVRTVFQGPDFVIVGRAGLRNRVLVTFKKLGMTQMVYR